MRTTYVRWCWSACSGDVGRDAGAGAGVDHVRGRCEEHGAWSWWMRLTCPGVSRGGGVSATRRIEPRPCTSIAERSRTPMTEVTARFRMVDALRPDAAVACRQIRRDAAGRGGGLGAGRAAACRGRRESFVRGRADHAPRVAAHDRRRLVDGRGAGDAAPSHARCGPGQNAYAFVADRDCASGFTCDHACGSVCLARTARRCRTCPRRARHRARDGRRPHPAPVRNRPAVCMRHARRPAARRAPSRPYCPSLRALAVERARALRPVRDAEPAPAWVVDTAAITRISVGPRSSVTSCACPRPGSRSLATSVRLRAQRGEQVSQALRLVARPVPPAQAFGGRCRTAGGVGRGDRSGRVPDRCDCAPTPGPPLACRTECGRRCVFR